MRSFEGTRQVEPPKGSRREFALDEMIKLCVRHMVLLALLLLLCARTATAQIADLSLTKSGPASALNGDSVTYTLSISSVGPNAANGATFSDALPAGLTNVSATCTAAINGAACPASLTVSSSAVSGAIPTLPANGGVTILIFARFPVGGNDTSLTNRATVTVPLGVTDPVPSSNSSFINTALAFRTADLRITKIASTTSYALGSAIDYTVTLINLGPGPADGTSFRDRLTAATVGTGSGGAIVSTVNSVSCTATGGAICPTFTSPATVTTQGDPRASIAIPTLPSGGEVRFVIRVTPTGYSSGTCGFTRVDLINTGAVTGMPTNVLDTVAANNAQAQTAAGPTGVIPACPQVDIGTTKSVTPTTTLTFGQPVTYTMVYFNNGPGDASGTRIADALNLATTGPGLFAQMAYSGASILSCVSTPGTTCPSLTVPAAATLTTATSSVFDGTVTTWPAGGRLTITYTLTPQSFGASTCGFTSFQLRNATSRTIPTGFTDPGPGANTASATNNLPTRSLCVTTDVSVSKTLLAGQMGLGQTLTYHITVSNVGSSTATSVTFADTILHSNVGIGVGNPYLSINNVAVGSCTAFGPTVCPTIAAPVPSLNLTNVAQVLVPSTTIASMGPSSSISFTATFVQASMNATCQRVNAVLDNRVSLAPPLTYVDSNSGNNTSAVTATFSCADISTNKTVTPTNVSAGNTLTFTFEVTNSGPATLTNVPFSDPLPTGFSYLFASCSSVIGGAVCSPPVFTPVPASVDGTITTMPPNSAVRYTIVGLAGSLPGSWNNRGEVRIPLPGIFDPDLISNASAVSFNVTSDFPSVSKLTTRPNTTPSGTTGFTIIVSNPSAGLALTNLRLTDFLPTGWTYVTTTGVTLNAGATRPSFQTPTFGAVTPTWGHFNLGANSSIEISFVASVPSAQTCGAVVSNEVTATYTRGGGTQTSAYLGNSSGLTSDDVTVYCPQVGAAKSLLSQVDNGDGSFSLQYAIRFRNSGNEPLNPIQFSDALATAQGGAMGSFTATDPPSAGQYRVASAPVFFGACTGMTLASGYDGSVQRNLATGSLAAAQECEVRMTVQMAPTATVTTYTNQAVISGTGTFSTSGATDLSDDGVLSDPASNNGSGSTDDPTPAVIAPSAALEISKSNSLNTLVAGQTTAYTVTLSNAGPSGVLNSVLRDVSSAGLVCTSATCNVVAGSGVCPSAGVAPGELSIPNLIGPGVLIPRINSGAQMEFVVVCDVTATGLP